MSRSESDSNVLLGLMAVQLDFIDETTLLDALKTWSFAKQKSLAEILVERGRLSMDRRLTLEKLVHDHVAVHSGDTNRSLAALSVRNELLAELQTLTDDDVEQSVGQLTLASLGGQPGAFATHQSSPGQHTVQPLDRPPPGEDFPTQYTPAVRKPASEAAVANKLAPAPEAVGEATVRPTADQTQMGLASANTAAPLSANQAGPDTVATPPAGGPQRRTTAAVAAATPAATPADEFGTHFTPPSTDRDQTWATTPGVGPQAATPQLDSTTRRGESRSPESSTIRYRRLRFHARGGLGQVSVAMDEELKREVALKELQSQHAQFQENCDRFVLEAEITGRLEHPGIVPVYGLGHYGDGRPYYAMRFIRGDNLKEAIDSFHGEDPADCDAGIRELAFRNLLGRFVDVCNAIEYAHSRGVLHRDLKPGNVMLGKYGETLVVDWGLAKTIDAKEAALRISETPIDMSSLSGSTGTQMGSVVGTPAYMSPEQARGRLDLLGPGSDIYSLGATLYHLLTGSSLFTGRDVSEVLARVERGEFPKPSKVKTGISPALEAICLKAMGNEIDQRYPTAAALAGDIESWLADEPVTAWTEPWSVRTRRWIRRHQALVSGGSAAVLVAILGLTITVVLLGAANEKLDQARDKAEDNFQLARDAVEKFLTAVSEEVLLNQDGMQPLREKLLKQALAYHQKFIQERADDPAVRDEVGKSYFYVARITEMLKPAEKGLPVYQQAEKLQRESLKANETDQRLIALSTTLNAIGKIHHEAERFDEAQKYYDEALTLRKKAMELRKKLPDTPENRAENNESLRLMANTQMNLGDLETERGRAGISEAEKTKHFDQARTLMDAAQALRETVAEQEREGKLKRDLGKGHFNLSVLEFTAQRIKEGEERIKDAKTVFSKLVEEGKKAVADNDEKLINQVDYLESQRNLAICYRVHADLLTRSKQPEEFDRAGPLYEKARDVAENLYNDNSKVHDYRGTLAGILLQISQYALNKAARDKVAPGAVVIEKSVADAVLPRAEQAVELLKLLSTGHAKSPRYQHDYAAALWVRAELLLRANRVAANNRDQLLTDLATAQATLALPKAEDERLSQKIKTTLKDIKALPITKPDAPNE